jgi:methyltransferase
MVIPLGVYLAFLVALGAERIVELVISARNAHWAFARGAIEAGSGHYPAMAVFHTLFIVSCGVEAAILRRVFPGALGWIALTGALSAQALRYWAIITLGRRWNTRIIVLPGVALMTSGPYRLIRHPNYLAVVVEMICVPMIYGCWITAIVFSAGNALLLRVRIKAEESALGQTYQQSFGSVPRLVPRPRH